MTTTDRDLLLDLFGGAEWCGWDTDADLSDWTGVKVNDQGRVVELDLSNSNLEGPISGALGDLDELRVLKLNSNELTGHIPSQLGNLGALEHLDLSDNKLNGHIPEALGGLGKLKVLKLNGNELTGEIPSSLGQLGSLEVLDLGFNQLNGEIPSSLGQLEKLQELSLGVNHLGGEIPSSLGQLGSLEAFSFGVNQLNGEIPSSLGQLGKLQELDLRGNQLHGEIPSSLGQLGSLEVLDLRTNQLHGEIPSSLGQLGSLTALYLTGNQLQGEIPSSLGQLGSLQKLDLRGNQLHGNIPSSLGQLGSLKALYLSGNQLYGEIPSSLGQLQNLYRLDLHTNQLNGEIPSSLGQLGNLLWLYLRTNRLSGEIPSSLGQLECLEVLDLRANQLSGRHRGYGGPRLPLNETPRYLDLGRAVLPPAVGFTPMLYHLRPFIEDIHIASTNLGNLGRRPTEWVGEAEDALRLVDRPGTVVELANNPWIMPPEAVVEAGLPATKEYLLDVQMAKNAGADVTSLKLLKVVLVGSASAGKTSLMQSIIERRGSPTKGTRADASTVGVELCPHQLEDTEVEFFDCAGQVDYAGMHQTFLTRRALYLLVVDITKYSVEILDEVIQEDIMRWLYYLYLRAPGSTVILVANKCDGSIDDYTDTVRSVQNRVLELLKDWHEDRGLRGQSKGRVTDVNILPDMSRVSCDDKGFPEASGIPALIALLLNQAATSICVPPAWDFALEAIKCLRASRDPIWAAREKLGLSNTPPTEGVGNLHASPFISKNELSRKWELVVETVRGNVPAATVYNWESALNGALWISDFAGHTLRIDGGDGIFLDVLWLSKVLNPIVSHKTKHHRFNHEVLPMKRKLVEDNILQPEFALHLWGMDIDRKTLPPEEVKRALFRILAKLGVALPLGCAAHEDRNGPRDMLVIMRLEEKCDSDKHRLFEQSLAKNRLPCDREVMLKWEFDRAGAPQGLVERLIASCHVLGEVDSKVCWRYGAVFKSHFKESSAEGKRSLFTVALSMASYSGPEREFTARVVGPLANARVWAAIRYVASVMLTLSKEWPGVLWEAWPVCTEGHAKTVYLASSAELGDLLLPAAAPNAGREEWCECLLESRGVLAQVREKLGVVIDTGKDPFDGLQEEPGDPPGSDGTGATCTCVDEAFDRWLPHAWVSSKGLWSLAVALFLGAVVVGIVEDEDTLWKSCLAVVVFLVVLGVCAAAIAYRFPSHREAGEEQRQSGGQQGMPVNDVAAMA